MKAKIYKIGSAEGPKVYIGSTTKPLSTRFINHRCKADCSSTELFDEYGYEDCYIKEIEEVDGRSRGSREQYWIHRYGGRCVNRQAV